MPDHRSGHRKPARHRLPPQESFSRNAPKNRIHRRPLQDFLHLADSLQQEEEPVQFCGSAGVPRRLRAANRYRESAGCNVSSFESFVWVRGS